MLSLDKNWKNVEKVPEWEIVGGSLVSVSDLIKLYKITDSKDGRVSLVPSIDLAVKICEDWESREPRTAISIEPIFLPLPERSDLAKKSYVS